MNSQSLLKKQIKLGYSLATQRPFSLLLQVTNRCNYTCSFCDFWKNGVPHEQEVQLHEYERLAEDLSQLGTFIISIEGGEPFLRKDLIEIVRIFSRKHFTVLYTNGWFVNDEKAQSLIEAGLHQVGISIDFPQAEDHDKKRGKVGAFNHVFDAVKSFKKFSKNPFSQIHLMTVLMDKNQHQIEDLLKLSAAQGIGHNFTLLSKKGFRRGQSDSEGLPKGPLSADLLKLHKKYKHFKVFRNYIEGIDLFLERKDLPGCTAGVQSFNIDHIGQVSTCIEKINKPYGNVREESILSIYKRVSGSGESKNCQDCWTLCRGFSQNLSQGGSLNSWVDLVTRMS